MLLLIKTDPGKGKQTVFLTEIKCDFQNTNQLLIAWRGKLKNSNSKTENKTLMVHSCFLQSCPLKHLAFSLRNTLLVTVTTGINQPRFALKKQG